MVLPTMEVTMIKEKKQVQMIWSIVQDDEMSRSLKSNAVVKNTDHHASIFLTFSNFYVNGMSNNFLLDARILILVDLVTS